MKEYLYGINPAFEVVRAGKRRIYCVYIADTIRNAVRTLKLLELLKKAGVKAEFASKGRLFELCRTTEHQGVVVEAEAYPYVSFAELLEYDRILLLDNIEDPQNVGAILRSAESFGWGNVLLSSRGTAGVYPSVVKASAGASEHLRIARDHAANYYVREAVKNNFTVAALDGSGKTALNELEIPPEERVMLVIGGEHRGVGQLILNTARYVVRIPLRGKISSLNASVAAGVALYLIRNRFSADADTQPPASV
jgi:23S rRNA (guanosine2251-2'-O)-methyltransferase